MIPSIIGLIIGISVTLYSSEKVIEHATQLAKSLGIPTLLIGLLIVSLGTSLPEITNSIISSGLGHGNINVGDSIGSTLTQLTLVLGLTVLIGNKKLKCDCDTKLIGGGMLLGTILGVLAVEKGYLTRLDAVFLILSYYIILFYIYRKAPKTYFVPAVNYDHAASLAKLAVFLLLVGGGAFLTVESVIFLSRNIGVPEFIIAFFGVSIGTSLPELAVGLSALRKNEFELIIGNNFGSNLTDMTLSMASGPLLTPIKDINPVSRITGWYTVLVMALIVIALEHTREINKPFAVSLILVYFGSYLLIGL